VVRHSERTQRGCGTLESVTIRHHAGLVAPYDWLMKKTQSFLRITLFAAVSLATIQAAETVSYDQIPKGAPATGQVVTRDGKHYESNQIIIDPDQIRLFTDAWQIIPRDQVLKVQIRRATHLRNRLPLLWAAPLLLGAAACEGGSALCLLAFPAFAPIWPVAAVLSPIYLSIDGVSYLTTRRTYNIAP
jgi:hypothetical protein